MFDKLKKNANNFFGKGKNKGKERLDTATEVEHRADLVDTKAEQLADKEAERQAAKQGAKRTRQARMLERTADARPGVSLQRETANFIDRRFANQDNATKASMADLASRMKVQIEENAKNELGKTALALRTVCASMEINKIAAEMQPAKLLRTSSFLVHEFLKHLEVNKVNLKRFCVAWEAAKKSSTPVSTRNEMLGKAVYNILKAAAPMVFSRNPLVNVPAKAATMAGVATTQTIKYSLATPLATIGLLGGWMDKAGAFQISHEMAQIVTQDAFNQGAFQTARKRMRLKDQPDTDIVSDELLTKLGVAITDDLNLGNNEVQDLHWESDSAIFEPDLESKKSEESLGGGVGWEEFEKTYDFDNDNTEENNAIQGSSTKPFGNLGSNNPYNPNASTVDKNPFAKMIPSTTSKTNETNTANLNSDVQSVPSLTVVEKQTSVGEKLVASLTTGQEVTSESNKQSEPNNTVAENTANEQEEDLNWDRGSTLTVRKDVNESQIIMSALNEFAEGQASFDVKFAATSQWLNYFANKKQEDLPEELIVKEEDAGLDIKGGYNGVRLGNDHLLVCSGPKDPNGKFAENALIVVKMSKESKAKLNDEGVFNKKVCNVNIAGGKIAKVTALSRRMRDDNGNETQNNNKQGKDLTGGKGDAIYKGR